MVQYLPSTVSKIITISQLIYPTVLTLNIPAEVAEKTPFTASGKLTFREGGVDHGLQGRTINITGADTPIAVTTGSDGTYSTFLTISKFGTYTITASYAGETGLAASSSQLGIGVAGAVPPTIQDALRIALPLVAGLGLLFATRR